MLDYSWLLLIAVALGGIAQRATGMGFALVSAPLAIIALGPLEGVLMMNLLGIPAATLALILMWKRIEWNTVWLMIIPCAVGVWLGVEFIAVIDPAWLELGLGLVLAVAVVVTLKTPPLPETRSLVGPAIATGAFAGFLNAAASIGGPPLVVYRNLRKWSPLSFSPTIQPLLITMSGGSFVLKTLTGTVPLPHYGLFSWLGLVAALAIGVSLGELISRRLSIERLAQAITGIAIVGSLVTLVRGAMSLVG